MYMITSNYGPWDDEMLGVIGHIESYPDLFKFVRQTLGEDLNDITKVIASLRQIEDEEFDNLCEKFELNVFDDAESDYAEYWIADDEDDVRPYVFIVSNIKPFKSQ